MEPYSSKKGKYSKIEIACFFAGIGALFTGSAIRYGFFHSTLFQQHSFLLYLSLIFIWIYSKKGKADLSQETFDKNGLRLAIAVTILSLTIIVIDSGFTKMNAVISIIIPLFLITFIFRRLTDYRKVLSVWMNLMSVCVLLMIATEIYDIVSGYSFTSWMATYTGVPSFFRILKQNRPVTYMGHPLFSSEIFLAFYILKHLQNMIENKKDGFFWIVICLVGSAIAQARAGTLLIILSFFAFNLEWKKARFAILGGLLLIVAYFLGVFDSVINRILITMNSGDISAGRNASIISLMGSGAMRLYPFHGQSLSYDGSVTTLGMALEYPPLGWAYSFGYIVSALISSVAIVYPLVVSAIRKQKIVFLSLLFLILDVNSYSGISGNGDKPILFYIFLCLILNASLVLHNQQKSQMAR